MTPIYNTPPPHKFFLPNDCPETGVVAAINPVTKEIYHLLTHPSERSGFVLIGSSSPTYIPGWGARSTAIQHVLGQGLKVYHFETTAEFFTWAFKEGEGGN